MSVAVRDTARLDRNNAALTDFDAGADGACDHDQQTEQDQDLPFFLQEESLLRQPRSSDGQTGTIVPGFTRFCSTVAFDRPLGINSFDAGMDAAEDTIGNGARPFGDLLRIDTETAFGSEQRNGVTRTRGRAFGDVDGGEIHGDRTDDGSEPAVHYDAAAVPKRCGMPSA